MSRGSNNPILITSLINVASILIAAFSAYYFSRKKISYEKLFDRKLAYLEEIYGKIVSLEIDLKEYIVATGANMNKEFLFKKQEKITPIRVKFFELRELFLKKEIILDEDSVLAIQSFIDPLNEILSILEASIISQVINDTKTSSEQWNRAHESMEVKLVEAKKQLKDDFKKTIKT